MRIMRVDVFRRFLRNFALLYAAFIPFFVLFGVFIGSGSVTILLPLFYLVSFVLTYYLMETYHDWRDREAGTISGLYAHGLFVRPLIGYRRYFVPYSAIKRLEVKERTLFNMAILHLRGIRRPLKVPYLDELLSDDGMAFLERGITGTPLPEGPPELRVYGSGGVQSSHPMVEGDLEGATVVWD